MDFYHQYDSQLPARELALVEQARAFGAGAFSRHLMESFLAGAAFAPEWTARWAGLGMLGLQAKPEHGGFGASFLCKVRVAQELAHHGFAAAFCLNHHQSCVTRLSLAGTPEQVARLLPQALSGERLLTIAMSEPAGGSDATRMAATARKVDGGWRLTGTKKWVTDGLLVGGLILLAHVEEARGADSIASFLVTLDAAESVTRAEVLVPGARAFRLAQIRFDDHFIPDWALMARPGEALRSSLATINAARVHVAAMAVASLRAGLGEAVAYCGARSAFGKPLTQHQGLRWELAQVATRLEAANALVFRAADEVQRGTAPVTRAAQAKAFAVDTALWGLDQLIRALGASGASAEHRLAMQLAEVRMAAYADGTNEMLVDRVGRALAADYPEIP